MKIAISGASGFVGKYLGVVFDRKGWTVAPITRQDLGGNAEGLSDLIEGADVIVNLAGAPIIKKWTRTYKKELYSSRVDTTKKIVGALKRLEKRPRAFLSASAIGIYGTEGTHTEEMHSLATDFLGSLTRDWEQAALEAQGLNIRTVIFRFGVVLGKGGGALQSMLPPFKAGIGGAIGDGRQPFSWVHIEDLARAFTAAIEDERFKGVYNLTAPNPTTNRELTKTLGKILKRPTVFRVPAFVLKLQFGEGAQVLVKGQRVVPQRLLEGGFDFEFPDLETALRDCVS
jgi:uncharacterized protein (TIGR01777 family)